MCKNGDQEENLKEMKIYGEGKNVIKFRSVGRNIQAAVFFFRSAGWYYFWSEAQGLCL